MQLAYRQRAHRRDICDTAKQLNYIHDHRTDSPKDKFSLFSIEPEWLPNSYLHNRLHLRPTACIWFSASTY